MGKLHIIHCEDCGAPRMTKYGNTKYCEICRLARNLNFMKGQKFKCGVSGKRYAPVKRNQGVCLECDPYSTPGGPQGDCPVCGTDDTRLYGEHVRVCVSCMDSIEKRPTIYAALLKKQAQIKSGEITIPTPELPGEAHEG